MAGRATNEPSNYFAFGFQSAKDSEASTFQFLKHLSGTGFEVQPQTEDIMEGGDGQEVALRIKTAINADGQWVENDRPENSHRAWVAVLGADSIGTVATIGAGASSVCNEHIAVPTSGPQPYLTCEQNWADVLERSTNNLVSDLTLDFEAGRPLKETVSFLSGGSVAQRPVASALTPTRESGKPFMYPGATVVVDGAGNGLVTKGSIKVTRDIDGDIRTVALTRQDVITTSLKTSIALTLKYEDATLYNKVRYGGGSQVPIDLATGSLRLSCLIGAGTAVRYQETGVNQFNWTDARVNRLDPDGKTMYIDATAEGYKGATHQVYRKTLIATAAKVV